MIREKIFNLIGVAAIILLATFFLNAISTEQEEIQIAEKQRIDGIYSPYIPEELSFAGEKVPLENFDVYESLDNELMALAFWEAQTLRHIKRAYRYFPTIEPILAKNGVPDDFKYLVVAETGIANLVSPSKAEGYWQFLEKTGKEFGLVVTDEVDERYNLVKSTQAACQYFKQAHRKLGNWALVAASYNMGMGGVAKRVEEQQTNSYFDLHLNTETGRYLYRILAIKLIHEHPERYGYRINPEVLYKEIPTDTVLCDTTINNLKTYALAIGSNYKMLKLFNPWLHSDKLTNDENKTYQILIPKAGFRNFAKSK